MKPLLNIISNCKDDLNSYKITLNSLNSLKDRIRLVSVIRCKKDLIKDFKKAALPFKHKKIIFNSDSGLYNALNISMNLVDKNLPFLCLHSGDLLFDKNIPFLIELLSKPMSKYSMYLFSTYLFNIDYQNLKDLMEKPENSFYIKNFAPREPKNYFIRRIYLFFSYNLHQSIIYSPELNSLRFNENVGLAADILYNHKAYKISKKLVRFNKFLCFFNKNGLSSVSPIKEKIESRTLILFRNPTILFDQRFFKGCINITIKYLFNLLGLFFLKLIRKRKK